MSNFQPVAAEFNQDGTLVKIWGPNSQVAFDPSSVAITGGLINGVPVSQISAGKPSSPGAVVALLGDSITANNSTNTGGTSSMGGRGYFSWAHILSGKRLNFSLANNFGVSGDRLDQIALRTANVIGAAPDLVIVHGGTNDLLAGRTFAQMQSSMLNDILVPLFNSSSVRNVIVIPILPRTGLSTAQASLRAYFNRWLIELGLGRSDLVTALPAGRLPIVVPMSNLLEDMSNGTPIGGASNLATSVTSDGLHPSLLGAYWMGFQLNAVISQIYPPRPSDALGFADIYDPVNNPAGNLLITGGVNAGIMAGTGGTLTTSSGLTPTGVVANGLRIFRSAGTSVATMVGAKENPRTDLANPAQTGERQRITVNVTGAGLANELYVLNNVSATLTQSNFAAGDMVYAECKMQVLAGATNLQGFQLGVTDAGTVPQNGLDAPAFASTPVLPGVAWTGTLRTPPITLGTSPNISVALQAWLNTTTGSASVDFYVSDLALRKVV